VWIEQNRNREQVVLLLVLVTDHLSGFGLLGIQSLLASRYRSDRHREIGPG
jgi:hypothetical protein